MNITLELAKKLIATQFPEYAGLTVTEVEQQGHNNRTYRIGDPACDLVIAWTYLSGKARDIFVSEMGLDDDTWLRSRAWVLWKATFELCNIADTNSPEALWQKKIIDEVL